MRTRLTDLLGIEHPLIMAPMFLVSNVAMVKEGMRCGVAGCIPALNYRTLDELRAATRELKAAKAAFSKGAYGFNLIVNKSNPKAAGQMKVLFGNAFALMLEEIRSFAAEGFFNFG